MYKIHINEKRWVGRLPVQGIQSGDLQLFDHDRRPQMVVDVCGSIEGFRILELGPLESAHTYRLERLGAGSILCTEASPEFRGPETPPVERHGFRCHYFEVFYPGYDHTGRRWSGVMPSCNRLYQKDIIAALEYFGFDKVTITEDNVNNPNGPAVALVAEKTGPV
jgi:hypothetical protein